MKTRWICKDCQTVYYGHGDEKPPSVNWSDGHKCQIVKDEAFSRAELLADAIKTIYSQCKDGCVDQSWEGWKKIKDLITLEK